MEVRDKLNLAQLDDWAPPGLLHAAAAEWPAPDWRHWHSYQDRHAIKRASKDSARLPAAASLLVQLLAQLDLEAQGFPPGIFPDLELHGAGLHEIPAGGHLARHLDGATHPQTGWRRCVNGILFVSDDFSGGELSFTDADGRELQAVTPKRNRLVLFETHGQAWHEVRPVGGTGSRKSISLFWWAQPDSGPQSPRTCAEFS